MKIEDSYQQFLTETITYLNEQEDLVIFDHPNRSFSFEWLFNQYHTKNTYTFDERFYTLCNQKDGFRYAYHVKSVMSSGDSYTYSCLCFRAENGTNYSLNVWFQPNDLSMMVRYKVCKKHSDGKWRYETVDSNDITPDMRQWQHVVLDELYRSSSLRLFHITGALKLDDEHQA